MSDFSSKQPAPEGVGPTSKAPVDQGGEPTTGFVQAPHSERAPTGPGPGVPANKRTIH